MLQNNGKMTVKKTYAEVLIFTQVAAEYMKKSKENFLMRAIMRIEPKIKKLLDKYNAKKNHIELKLCSVSNDDHKTILRDDKGFLRFTPENQIKVNNQLTDLLNEEVDVPAHYVSPEKLPQDIDFYNRVIFEGFVIRPEYQGPEAEGNNTPNDPEKEVAQV